MSSRLAILSVAALAAATLIAPGAFAASNDSSCFDARELRDWKSPDPNVIYLRVNAHDVYRLDLSTGSNQLKYSDVRLVDDNHSTSRWVCDPLELDLRVTDSHNTFDEPLIVKSITKLTPDEVAAIPPKFRP